MNLSSIFNFSTLSLRHWRGGLLALVVAGGVLVLIDALLSRRDPMRLYGGWENPHVDHKIRSAGKLAERYGRVDVLLLSSSIGLQTDVGRWQEAAADEIVCFNGAMGGQKPQWARFLFENVYYSKVRPRMLVYCVSPRDVNARGFPGHRWRFNGPLWDSAQARRLRANSLTEKLTANLEVSSYLFGARRHIRSWLQTGPIPQDTIVFTQENGVNLPTVRKLPDIPPPSEHRQQQSAYDNFSAPDDGELHDLRELARFCKDRGVEFILVNQPVAPLAHAYFDDPENDYKEYLAALDQLRSAGIRVLDAAAALSLRNSHFGDADHPNRWGAEKITNFLFEKIIHPAFEEKMLVKRLPQSAELHFSDWLSSSNRDFFTQNFGPVAGALFAAELQTVARYAGGRLPLGCTFPKGNYHVDLYGADEKTTGSETSESRGHQLSLATVPKRGKPTVTDFEMSRLKVQGAALTRMTLNLDSSSSLSLEVRKLHGPECVLDSLFLTPAIGAGPLPWSEAYDACDGLPVHEAVLIRNASFEFKDLRREGYPAEWLPYTGEREPWGDVELTREAHSGNSAVAVTHLKDKGWGGVIVQDFAPSAVELMRGREVEFSVWAKSTQKDVFGSLVTTPGEAKDVRFSPYTTPGKWQRLSARAKLDPALQTASIRFGALNGTRVVLDDAEIKLLPKVEDIQSTATVAGTGTAQE